MPDNASAGTLETLLLQVAALNYPSLLQSAEAHVANFPHAGLTAADQRECNKNAGRNKAVVGTMSAILKPGKAIQVSIEDNRWLEGPALALPGIADLLRFLTDLLS